MSKDGSGGGGMLRRGKKSDTRLRSCIRSPTSVIVPEFRPFVSVNMPRIVSFFPHRDSMARAMIWTDGQLPANSPQFANELSADLLSYGLSLVGAALRYEFWTARGQKLIARLSTAVKRSNRLATAGVLGCGLVLLAALAQHHALAFNLAQARFALGQFLVLLPVCFVMEEVAFRGVLDSHIHHPRDSRPWLSALFFSAM
jgi:hypothetical protein